MSLLIVGLLLFLGAHSVQIFAAPWREAFIAKRGPGPWKGLYSLMAGLGFVLIIVGYANARAAPPLWGRPPGALHLAMGLVATAFILLTAAYWPRNHIKTAVRDPMVLGVGVWALGHLMVKASLPALLLFGGFLAWAILDFLSLRRRPSANTAGPAPTAMNTIGTVVVGLVIFFIVFRWGHIALIGVSPAG